MTASRVVRAVAATQKTESTRAGSRSAPSVGQKPVPMLANPPTFRPSENCENTKMTMLPSTNSGTLMPMLDTTRPTAPPCFAPDRTPVQIPSGTPASSVTAIAMIVSVAVTGMRSSISPETELCVT